MVIHATADSQQYHPSLVECLKMTFYSMRACKVYMSLPAASAARDAFRSGGIIMAQTRTVSRVYYTHIGMAANASLISGFSQITKNMIVRPPFTEPALTRSIAGPAQVCASPP